MSWSPIGKLLGVGLLCIFGRGIVNKFSKECVTLKTGKRVF